MRCYVNNSNICAQSGISTANEQKNAARKLKDNIQELHMNYRVFVNQ